MNTLIYPNPSPKEKTPEQTLSADMSRLARFPGRDISGLSELLAACHSAAASDRALGLAKIFQKATTDPAALRASIAAVIDDLHCLPSPVEIRAPELLRSQAAETLDGAVLYHLGRLESVLRELDM